MKFKSQICTTVEQSKRLLELGLKPETADMCWLNDMQKPFCSPYKCLAERAQDMKWVIFPAWSLHRLIEIYVERYISCNINLKELTFDWVINAIEIHIKNEYFNKKYLK